MGKGGGPFCRKGLLPSPTFHISYNKKAVASPKKIKKPALSVMAVRKMLEACAGSRPTARKIRGMLPPASAPSSMSPMSAAPMTMPSSGEEEVNQTPTQASIAMITPEAMPILPSRNTAIHARLRSNFSVAS